MHDFSLRASISNGGHDRNEIWHKGSLDGEDDARTSNTCIAHT